jgi:hypothetical protein
MPLMSDQGLKMVQATAMFGVLVMVAMPVWAEEKQDVVSEAERTARIRELQRDRATPIAAGRDSAVHCSTV